MTVRWTLLALLTASCTSSVCADYPGTCVELELRTDANDDSLDQVSLVASGVVAGKQTTPTIPTDPFHLPKRVALQLGPATAGALTIDATGLRAGHSVSTGETQLVVTAGEHAAALLVLHAVATATDAGVIDAGGSDAATPSDLSLADLAPPPRLMFVTSQVTAGNFGVSMGSVDSICTKAVQATAHDPVLDGHTFMAFVTRPYRPNLESALGIDSNSTRSVTDLDGRVICMERDLFTPMTSQGPRVDELGTAHSATAGDCVWTGLPQGAAAEDNTTNCEAWTAGSANQSGMVGKLFTLGAEWRSSQSAQCTRTCRIYCLEVP